jgi:hypothetical protein
MNRKSYIILLALLIKLNFLFAQDQKVQLPLRYSVVKEALFEVYEPAFNAISTYTSADQPNYSTPEDIILSEHAANTQDWINELYLPQDSTLAQVKPSSLRERNSQNKEETYFRLLHKLSLVHEGFPVAIIKTRLIMGGKPTFLSYSAFQQQNGRWYKWLSGDLEAVKNVVMQLKSEVLVQLLSGESTGDALIDELIGDTRSPENTLDFEKAFNLIVQWHENGRTADLDRIRDPFMLN